MATEKSKDASKLVPYAARPPEQDTRPLDLGELQADQQLLAQQLHGLLCGIQAKAGGKLPELSPWAKVIRDRTHRVVMLDGDRGTGKTSVLLTLLDAWDHWWNSPGQPRDPQSDWKVVFPDVNRRWRAMRQLDFDPLPASIHAYSWLVYAFKELVVQVENGGKHVGHQRSGTGAVSLLDEWKALYEDALVGWDDDLLKAKPGQDLDEYIAEKSEREHGWTSLVRRWRSFLDRLLEALERSGELDRDSLLVLPIDDIDLHERRGRELIQALRLTWHPRLVYVLTGNSLHLKQSLAAELVDNVQRAQFVQNGPEIYRQLASDIVDKIIPPAHRLSMPLFPILPELEETLEKHFDWRLAILVATLREREVQSKAFGFRVRDLQHIRSIGWAVGTEDSGTERAFEHAVAQSLTLLSQHGVGRLVEDHFYPSAVSRGARFTVFAQTEPMAQEVGLQTAAPVEFLRIASAGQAAPVPAEDELVLAATLVSRFPVLAPLVAWEDRLVSLLFGIARSQDLPVIAQWPVYKQREPAELLLAYKALHDAANGAEPAGKSKRLRNRTPGKGDPQVKPQEWALVAKWAELELDQPDVRDINALLHAQLRNSSSIKELLWFAVPESGLSAALRLEVLHGVRDIRESGTSARELLEEMRTLRLSRMHALNSKYLGKVLQEVDVREAAANGPWASAEYLLCTSALDWHVDWHGTFGGLLRADYEFAAGAKRRPLWALFAARIGGVDTPLASTRQLSLEVITLEQKHLGSIRKWFTELGELWFARSPRDGASRLVDLWTTFSNVFGDYFGVRSIEARLSDDGTNIELSGRRFLVSLPGDSKELSCGAFVFEPRDWSLSWEEPGGWSSWGSALLLAILQVRYDNGHALPLLEEPPPSLVTFGQAQVPWPIAQMGWLASEWARLWWDEVLRGVSPGWSPEAARRWLFANAIWVVWKSWNAPDAPNLFISPLTFPVADTWFVEFLEGQKRELSLRDPRWRWLRSARLDGVLRGRAADSWDNLAKELEPVATEPGVLPLSRLAVRRVLDFLLQVRRSGWAPLLANPSLATLEFPKLESLLQNPESEDLESQLYGIIALVGRDGLEQICRLAFNER